MAVIGRVSLVGAGPGDPGLLTRRAVARLRSADLVLYDALVDERILRYARKAQRFFVGKRAGRHAMTQDAIHRLLIRGARRGKHVVRLKGGDPFVFGRGGEEALALHRAGIRYDIVPGISSAIAAPAAAGIPVTHRGLSTAFLVVSAHDEASFALAIEGLRPNRVTLVVLMGMGRTAPVACRLIDMRWSRRTPVAIITAASTPEQQIRHATLDDLAEDRVVVERAAPGTIVIGDVVGIGRALGAQFGAIELDSVNPGREEYSMSVVDDPRTFGRTRLSFADVRDIDEFVATLEQFERGEITADQWRAFRLVRGTYGQRQSSDAQMLRVKIPQGLLTVDQLDALAHVGQHYSRGFGHITTRQNLQFHFVKLHDVEPAMRVLAAAGLTTREACGNSVRNITACPFAGVGADERFDVTPYG